MFAHLYIGIIYDILCLDFNNPRHDQELFDYQCRDMTNQAVSRLGPNAREGNEEGNLNRAVQSYKILTLVLGVLGVGMLVCGIVATLNIDEEVFGPPYFIGGYTVGVTASFSALMCVRVITKAEDTNTVAKRVDIGRAIYHHYVVSIFMLCGCIVGLVVGGIGGTAFSDDNGVSPFNKKLALVTLVGCILGLLVVGASMCIMCKFAQLFGEIATQGHTRGQTMPMNTRNTVAPAGRLHTNTTTFQTQPVNNTQVNQLQMQNQLLQQQLDLQRQLNLQQHQQQQYGGGFPNPAYPPPPTMLPSPPKYDDVMKKFDDAVK